jgi:hypothetical protein
MLFSHVSRTAIGFKNRVKEYGTDGRRWAASRGCRAYAAASSSVSVALSAASETFSVTSST